MTSIDEAFSAFLLTNSFRRKHIGFNQMIFIKDPRQIVYLLRGKKYVANVYTLDSFDYDWMVVELFADKINEICENLETIKAVAKNVFTSFRIKKTDKTIEVHLFPKEKNMIAMKIILMQGEPYNDDAFTVELV